MNRRQLPKEEISKIVYAYHHDPFQVLGMKKVEYDVFYMFSYLFPPTLDIRITITITGKFGASAENLSSALFC